MRKAIAAGAARLSYVDRPGAGPVLVLIPGSFSDVHQWDEVVDGLSADLRLILVEVRGHGRSWPPPVDGTIEEFGEDVVRIADGERIDRFYVGGQSIGGMIALEVGRCQPGRINGVISIEGWTHGRAVGEAFHGDMYGTLTPKQDARRLEAQRRAVGHWSQEEREAFAQIYLKWERGYEFLRATRLPVLELYGDRGEPRPSLERLRIPDRENITVHWLGGASHDLPLERPADVARVITEFIRAVEERKLSPRQ